MGSGTSVPTNGVRHHRPKKWSDAFDDFTHGHFWLGNAFEDYLHKVVVEQFNVLLGETCGLVSEIEIQAQIICTVHDGEIDLLF